MSYIDALLDQPLCAGHRPSAKVHVERALRAVLPPNVPPSWVSIDAARYVSAQPRHEATAELTMFDGRPAKVRVWFWDKRGTSYAHEWAELPGGHCSFEAGEWIRVDPETLEPMSSQLEMFAALPSHQGAE